MNKKRVKNLNLAFLERLTNEERRSFFKGVYALFSTLEFESDEIRVLLNNIEPYLELQDDLSKTTLAHYSTPEIVEKTFECRAYMTRVNDSVMSLRYLPDAESKQRYKRMTMWLHSSDGTPVLTRTRVKQEALMQALSTGYKQDDMIGEDLEELGVKGDFLKAMGINSQLIHLTNVRTADKGHYKNVRSSEVEESIFNFQLLMNEIVKMAHLEGNDQKIYQDLCISIDTRIIEVRAIYRARMTRLANLKNGEEVEDNLDDNSNDNGEENIGSEESSGPTPDSNESNSDATNGESDS